MDGVAKEVQSTISSAPLPPTSPDEGQLSLEERLEIALTERLLQESEQPADVSEIERFEAHAQDSPNVLEILRPPGEDLSGTPPRGRAQRKSG